MKNFKLDPTGNRPSVSNQVLNPENGVSLIITLFTASYIFFIRRVQAVNNARKFKILKSESGVSLIITLFIMIIILAVVLSVSTLLYSQVKVIRNTGNSVVSFYAADSGIEKVLYCDRQVIPDGAKRGLCSILDSCAASGSGDSSIYCIPNPSFTQPKLGYKVGSVDSAKGCDYDTCDDCTIGFSTTFDGRTYYLVASVNNSASIYSDITSKGIFPLPPITGGAQRTIEITSPLAP